MINSKSQPAIFVTTLMVVIIASAWFLSTKLTQKRLQIEATNLNQNIKQEKTPYIWHFYTNNDFKVNMVGSFQKYWKHNANQEFIVSKEVPDNTSKIQLSLNFSSESINANFHDKLIIKSPNILNTDINLLLKSSINSKNYFFSEKIRLAQSINVINLKQLKWQMTDGQGNVYGFKQWHKDIVKINSMVLIFKNFKNEIVLNNIEMPYASTPKNLQEINVNCSGISTSNQFHNDKIDKITLDEFCLLPSNYMWLKQKMKDLYPHSVFTVLNSDLRNIDSTASESYHYINKSYTSLWSVNIWLYGYVCLMISIIYFSAHHCSSGIVVPINPTKLNTNKYINSSKVYSMILLPSALIAVLMLFTKDIPQTTLTKIIQYLPWALLQQYILGALLAHKIFYHLLQNKHMASLSAAMVFSLLHLPSITLFLATLISGTLWAYAYLKFKKLLPLAISHAVLANLFYATISEKHLFSAKVLQWFWE